MASTPLTLAALATSAVPELRVDGVRTHTAGGAGAFVSAVLASEEGELIVRIPRTAAAEVQQSAELLGLGALLEGARSRLPFEVPRTLGMTRAGDSRAVVSTFLAGGLVSADDLESDALLLQPLAEALAAIHELPVSLVQEAGLPLRSAEEVRVQALRLVERAEATRLLPETVHERWSQALRAPSLWDFAPTVVHGSLDVDQLRVEHDRITGVLGWSELSAGDPAADLAWLLGSGPEVLEAVLARYGTLRTAGHLGRLRARARFHHELGVARWLLHGVESHDDAVVDDAIGMLDRMVDRLGSLSSPVPMRATATGDEVDRLLDEVPEVHDARSETAEYDALDEDRVFAADDDFFEPEPESESDSESESGSESGAEREPGPVPETEQETVPIDPLDHRDP